MNFNLRALHVFSVSSARRGEEITPNNETGGRKLAALSPHSKTQRLLWHGGSSPPIICEHRHKMLTHQQTQVEQTHTHTHEDLG